MTTKRHVTTINKQTRPQTAQFICAPKSEFILWGKFAAIHLIVTIFHSEPKSRIHPLWTTNVQTFITVWTKVEDQPTDQQSHKTNMTKWSVVNKLMV